MAYRRIAKEADLTMLDRVRRADGGFATPPSGIVLYRHDPVLLDKLLGSLEMQDFTFYV